MESIAETVFADVLFVCSEIFTITVHIRQNIHMVMLEHLILLS